MKTIVLDEWLDALKHGALMADARSPGEFGQGHIPGAINLPLLSDEERHLVGICYKKKGHDAAVRLGFELTGAQFAQKIDSALAQFPKREIFLYCWRGGLRSQILGWILSTAGFTVHLLEGGYKSYRTRAHEIFAANRRILILAGKTGTGKTELLHALRDEGEYIVDLEGIANHKGSSFGALGQEPQPTQEHFENLLAFHLKDIPNDQFLWLEDESRYLGKMRIPDALFTAMNQASILFVDRSVSERKARILHEYGHFPIDMLVERTLAVSKRMGSEQANAASNALIEGNQDLWIELLLHYYDKTYSHTLRPDQKEPVKIIESAQKDFKQLAQLLSAAKKEIHVDH